MSESKYISVIHVPTDKIVTAFKFENDATWIGKEKDELIATANYCEPGQKIKMIFVKSFTKSNGKFIHPYFRSSPGQIKLKDNLSGESNEHKQCKQNVYDGIYSGEIKINGEIIDKKLIEDIFIEYRTSKSGYVIPDIMIKFKERHNKYGEGIFIEIQLSTQHEDETILRTYSRVIEGFSGIWLWKKDFDSSFELLNKDLEIKSYRKLLGELDDKVENKFIERINNYGEIIDKKISEGKYELWNTLSTYKEVFSKDIKSISYDKQIEFKTIRNEIERLHKLKEDINLNYIKQDLENIKKEYVKNFTDQIVEEYTSCIKITREALNEDIKQIVDKNSSALKRFCPNCNKPMKIGKAMHGYNWYCSDFPLKCDGLIKGVSFKDEG